MAKYDPLRDHLEKQELSELVLSFTEIERLVGPLPKSAERPQWWANVRSQTTTHVQREAWRQAGYHAFLIAGDHKVRFVQNAARPNQIDLQRGLSPKLRKVSGPPTIKPTLMTDALLAGGFALTSRWMLGAEGGLSLETPLPPIPGVYVFAMRGIAVYVGIASSGLARRLAFYIRPGVTQRTSKRVHARLLAELPAVGSVDILTATPPETTWNGWPVNISAGLEVSLIAKYNVAWNMRGI